ncbi:MAG: hypothetical protein ACLTER_01735 [Ruminococcus sp.]
MVDNVLNNGFGEKERREEIRKADRELSAENGSNYHTSLQLYVRSFRLWEIILTGLPLNKVTDKI